MRIHLLLCEYSKIDSYFKTFKLIITVRCIHELSKNVKKPIMKLTTEKNISENNTLIVILEASTLLYWKIMCGVKLDEKSWN